MKLSLAMIVMALGCSSGSKGPPLVFPLVNATLERGELGRPGWGYSRVFESDLDKDGKDERVILLAQVEVRNNQPLWDDSQAWQVYIEEPDGERSYVYSRIIQLGKLEMRISHDGIQPRILLWEDMPTVYALYEITYKGPQDWVTAALAQRHLDPRSFRGQ